MDGEQYVLKSRLPLLYWNEAAQKLDRLGGATIYTTHTAARAAWRERMVGEECEWAWSVLTLAEAQEEEK